MLSASAKFALRRPSVAGRISGVLSGSLSTVAARQDEEITVLRLNNLQDNPGAVKKVCALYSTSDVFCVLVSLFFASNALVHRNAESVVVLVLPKARQQGEDTRVKRPELVDRFRWALRVDKPNSTNDYQRLDG